MNCCKDKCDNYPSLIHLGHKYKDGLLAYCKTCSKRFYRKDCIGYRCFCCNGIVRTNARSRTRFKERRTVDHKCTRCHFFSKVLGFGYRQWCPDLDSYVDLCIKCGTPERIARGHEVVGAVFD